MIRRNHEHRVHASRPAARVARRGYSLLEVQVAFVVLGIGLAGLCPLVVIQSKQVRKLEARYKAATTYYLTPTVNPWARKLGVPAALAAIDPGPQALPPPPITLIDNGDAGYSESGTGWGANTQQNALNRNQRQHNSGLGVETASWLFTGLTPGWYSVRVTWGDQNNQATNAPYSVYDGLVLKGSPVKVKQNQAASGAIGAGRNWTVLGNYSIQGTTLKVVLSDDANNKVVADGVWIVPVAYPVQLNRLDKTMTGETVTAHVTVGSQLQ